MNQFQKKNIAACKMVWNERFPGIELTFMERHGEKIGFYYEAEGRLPEGVIELVIYEDEAGVAYAGAKLTWWRKFIFGGWGLPSYIFETYDYASSEALSAAFIERFSNLLANPPKPRR